jgi:DNA-binding NtrC family response regulator
MGSRPKGILLVEPEADVLEKLVAALTQRFDANITCVPSGEEAVETEAIEPHDLVICELELPQMSGLELADQLMALRRRPFILLACDATREEAVEAMRLGVRDLFVKPFRVRELMDSIERAFHADEVSHRHHAKYRRLRKLLRRAKQDRMEMHQRTELICRDLVGAHRKLVERVLALESGATSDEGIA